MNACLCLVAILASLDECLGSASQRQQDLVTDLPGLNHEINFKQYSGYFNTSCTHRLHYWFVESQRDPANDPLLIWMNGGPGCSSLEGFLEELGPFLINEDGKTLDKNPYAWNLEANVLFLEAPAGVGFSYSTDGNATATDDSTSEDNYNALKMFYATFPEYRYSKLFVGGESYGAVYVPTLTKRILDGNCTYPINVQGMYIGDGIVDHNLTVDTSIEFAYMHGLLSEDDWLFMKGNCCGGCNDYCQFHSAKGDACQTIVNNTMDYIWTGGLNTYNIYAECVHRFDSASSRVRLNGLAPPHVRDRFNLALDKQSLSSASSDDDDGPKGQSNCKNHTALEMYLNAPSVRNALHVEGHIKKFWVCDYQVEINYHKNYYDMRPQLKQIFDKGLRVLMYNGDVDMAINFLLAQRYIHNLGLKLLSKKKPWHHKRQVAGFWTKYKGLDFVTIKGAGHMVPTDRPVEAYQMIKRYLDNEPYSQSD